MSGRDRGKIWWEDEEADRVPAVGRPRGGAWRSLKSEGIVWEGQVFIVGDSVDLAARLILTRRRLALARGGGVALEAPRLWLRPAPTLGPGEVVTISIAPPEDTETTVVRLAIRDGRRAAGHLVSLLAGSGVRPVVPSPVIDIPFLASPDHASPSPALRPRSRFTPSERAAAERLPPIEPLPPMPLHSGSTGPRPGVDQLYRVPDPPVALGRSRDWNLRPLPGMVPSADRGRRRGWLLSLLGLVALLVIAAVVGADRLPQDVKDRDWPLLGSVTRGARHPHDAGASLTAPPAAPSPTLTATARPTASATRTGIATRAPRPARTAAAPFRQPTAPSGIGGEQPTATAIATATPMLAPSAAPTTAPPPQPLAPTAAIATATPAPSPPPPSPRPTRQTTATPTPSPTPRLGQAPSVGPRETPAPAVVSGPFRYTLEGAARGGDLAAAGLPSLSYGEWVVIVVQAENWSDQPATLAMTDFQLTASGPAGEPVALDAASATVASSLGFSPAFGSDSTATFKPGETHRLALAFVVSPEAADLSLLAGANRLRLDDALATSAPLTRLGAPPPAPDLVPAQVTEVIDGRTIAVQVNGAAMVVRYVGIAVPAGGQCGAEAAKQANATLVAGKTVWLERERTDSDVRGHLVRDVWVADGSGVRVNVAAQLAAKGMVAPSPSSPDLRYAAWLAATSAAARYQGVGLWAECGDAFASAAAADSAGAASPNQPSAGAAPTPAPPSRRAPTPSGKS